jgi:hypothetical protein
MSKPKADEVVRQMRTLFPNLVQGPRHFAGNSDDADVWLRKSSDGSEISAMAIEIPATANTQTQATLGKWADIASVPVQTIDTAVKQARSVTTSQPSDRQTVPGGCLTVTRFPETISVRVDYV